MKRFLALISIVLVGIFLLQGCKGKGILNKISDIEMTLAEGESEVSVNLLDYVELPKGKDVDFDTLDISVVEQGDYGTFGVTGEILTYSRTVQTDANDTGVLEVSDGTQSVLINVTVTSVAPVVWKQISAGDFHTVAIKSDGTLWAWGRNYSGQLGDGTTTDRLVPTQEASGSSNWIHVSTGQFNTAAVKNDGTVWVWGNNTYSQIGDGTTNNRLVPTQEFYGDEDWIQVSIKGYHTVALKSNGTLWAWGNNSSGQLGIGDTTNRFVPVQVNDETDWVQIGAGSLHTVALKSGGTVWSWGTNASGRLGDGTTTGRLVPTQEYNKWTDWVQVSAGDSYSSAIRSGGTLWSWGDNSYGQIGISGQIYYNTPTQEVSYSTEWEKVYAGYQHTAAIRSGGTLWSWGDNYYGELGDGTIQNVSVQPVQEATIATNWTQVSGGYSHTVALQDDGTLWVWGSNSYGQLGDGTTENRIIPEQQ